MMEGKVANGEWQWIDEAQGIMHTATWKPGLLRGRDRDLFGVELRVIRHEAFLEGDRKFDPESMGDLVIFDIDRADVRKETGNTKVFCQESTNYDVDALETLD